MTGWSLATAIETARRSVDAACTAHEAAVAHLRELEALAAGGEAPDRSTAPAVKIERAEPEWTNLARAAVYCSITEETMAQRAAKFGLGRKVGRGWMIDMARVRAHLEHRPFEPISQT